MRIKAVKSIKLSGWDNKHCKYIEIFAVDSILDKIWVISTWQYVCLKIYSSSNLSASSVLQVCFKIELVLVLDQKWIFSSLLVLRAKVQFKVHQKMNYHSFSLFLLSLKRKNELSVYSKIIVLRI